MYQRFFLCFVAAQNLVIVEVLSKNSLLENLSRFFHRQNDFDVSSIVIFLGEGECDNHDRLCQSIVDEVLSNSNTIFTCDDSPILYEKSSADQNLSNKATLKMIWK